MNYLLKMSFCMSLVFISNVQAAQQKSQANLATQGHALKRSNAMTANDLQPNNAQKSAQSNKKNGYSAQEVIKLHAQARQKMLARTKRKSWDRWGTILSWEAICAARTKQSKEGIL